MMRKFYIVFLLYVLVAACDTTPREVSIFSIPNDASPSELEAQGFMVHRKTDILGRTDRAHDGRVEFGSLNLIYADVYIRYGKDTNWIERYVVNIDCKPFRIMTGLKPKAYSTVEIDGFKYKIVVNPDSLSLQLTRIIE